MAYTITDPAVLHLLRELAERTGEPVDKALATAIMERLTPALEEDLEEHPKLVADVLAIVAEVAMRNRPSAAHPATVPPHLRTVADIQRFVASLPALDNRPADEVLYDECGLAR